MTNRRVSETIRAALRRAWWLSLLALPVVVAACNKGSGPGY
jgi:predicted small secreted protein